MLPCPRCQHLNPTGWATCQRCGSMLPTNDADEEIPAFAPGAIVGEGRYRVDVLLGEGGMGSVYKATDLRLGRLVALKVLRPELTAHPTARRRMEQEARALARIEHPNVVQVRNVFEHEGLLAMELEYMSGGDLLARIPQGGMAEVTALSLFRSVLAGLQAIHDAGLIHRDIKPDNVLLSADGTPKVTDLGVARDPTAREKTKLGAALGTVEYMAPEQVQGEPVDARCDVYSAGLVLYRMLTGRLPYRANSDLDWQIAHVREAPDLDALQGKCAPHVVEVIARSLAKERDERWQSARELDLALDAAASTIIPTSPRKSQPDVEPTAAPATPPQRQWAAGVVAALILVAAVASFAAFSMQSPPQPAGLEPPRPMPALSVPQPTTAGPAMPGPAPRAPQPDLPPSPKAASWCDEAGHWTGAWLMTSKVEGKSTRGRYHVDFTLDDCVLRARVRRDGFTTGTSDRMLGLEGVGETTVVVAPPQPGTLDMADVRTLLPMANGKRLKARMLLRREVNGSLTGVWWYDASSWNPGFFGSLVAVRSSALPASGYPANDGWNSVTHPGGCLSGTPIGPRSDGAVGWPGDTALRDCLAARACSQECQLAGTRPGP